MRSSVASDDWRPASTSPIDAQLSPDRLVGSEAQLVVHGSSVWVVVGGTVYAAPSGQALASSTPCGTGPGAQPAALAAADDIHLDVMCASGFAAAGRTSKRLMGSTDGGRTWTPSGPPFNGLSGQDGLADNGQGVLLSAESSVASQVQRTTDDGASFAMVLRDTAGQGRPWVDLGFTTPEQAVVVSAGRVLHLSRDAGATWAPVSFTS